jgi:ABC-type Fe3+-hydroxamate transport system substrate-binding protein
MKTYLNLIFLLLLFGACATVGSKPENAAKADENGYSENMDETAESPQEARRIEESEVQGPEGALIEQKEEPQPASSAFSQFDFDDSEVAADEPDSPTDGADYTIHLPEARTLLSEMVAYLKGPQAVLAEEEIQYFQAQLNKISAQFYWVPQNKPGQTSQGQRVDWSALRSAPWYEKARWEGSGLEGFMDERGERRLRLYQAVLTEEGSFLGVVLVTL